MWWVHAGHWLQANGFWVAVVAWSVFTTLTAAVAWLPWKRHRKAQKLIADRLDTSTPGGLTDVVQAIGNLKEDVDEGHR